MAKVRRHSKPVAGAAAVAPMPAEASAAPERGTDLLAQDVALLREMVDGVPALRFLAPRLEEAQRELPDTDRLLGYYRIAARTLKEELSSRLGAGSPAGDGDLRTQADELQAARERLVEALRERSNLLGDLRDRERRLTERDERLQEAAALLDRTRLEFQHIQQRAQANVEQQASAANEKLIVGLLPMLDNFNLALRAADQGGSVAAMAAGLAMIRRQLDEWLAKEGVVPVEASGLPFDPTVHEALMETAAPDAPEDTVVEVVRQGYYYKGKLLRAAQVSVARPPSASQGGSHHE